MVNCVEEYEDILVDAIFLLSKQFSRVLKKLEKKLGSFPSRGPKSSGNAGTNFPKAQHLKRDLERFSSDVTNKEKAFQCRECEGFGHNLNVPLC